MPVPVKVLLLEDNAADAKLALHALSEAGYAPEAHRVDREADFLAALDASLELILVDYRLPDWDGLAALAAVQRSGLDIPVIMVTGAIGDELAAAAIKLGAADYLLKDRLARLGPAVVRALEQRELRRARQRAEAEFAASEHRYRRLFESAQDGILLLNAETGRVVDANPFLTDLLGIPRDDLLGRKAWELDCLREIAGSRESFEELRRKEIVRTDDKPLRAADGRIVDVELVGTRYLEAGHPVFQCHLRDITAQKRTAAALHLRGAALAAAANSVVITDRHGLIEWVNPAFTVLTGYTPAEVVGRNERELLESGTQDREICGALWKTVLAGNVWHGAIVNRRKDGSRYHEEMTVTPVRDAAGTITHFIAVKQDVTERKRGEEALRASLQAQQLLLKDVHHRVKNNLQVVASLLRLEAGRAEGSPAAGVLQDMVGRIRAMGLLHESLYRSHRFGTVDMAAYLGTLATQLFSGHNRQAGAVRLRLDLAPAELGIEQAIPCGLIVNELVANSLKHAFPTAAAGEVVVALGPVPGTDRLQLRVADTGCGLPPGFDLARSTTLGLTLVSDLARQLRGVLAIAPPATFTVTFSPATSADVAPAASVSEAHALPGGHDGKSEPGSQLAREMRRPGLAVPLS